MVTVLAFSLQDELEKYGAYAGAAAFLGLAVLSLLYFAQARELKRLRDWAGRAPERAQEIEARVTAQAEEARRAIPAPVPQRTVGPAQPIPKPPAAPAPAGGNGRPTEAPALVPMGPRPAVAAASARTAEAVAVPVVAWPGYAEPEAEPEETPDEPGTVVAAPNGGGAAPPDTEDEAAAPAAGEEPADDAAPEEPAPEEEPAANGKPAATPEITPAPVPRATPRPAPVPLPRREPPPAAPLRAAGARSATAPPRRPTTPPGRRPAPARRDEGGSGAARLALFSVLGVLVLAGAAFGLMQVLGGDEDPAPPPNRATTPAGGPEAESGAGGQRAVDARPETVVVVLNGTPIEGLASSARTDLVERGYSDEQGMIRTGNNVDDQRQDSVVLFPEGQRRQARDVGSILGIERIEAIDDDTLALANLTDSTGSELASEVVVVLGADRAP